MNAKHQETSSHDEYDTYTHTQSISEEAVYRCDMIAENFSGGVFMPNITRTTTTRVRYGETDKMRVAYTEYI